MSRNSRPPQALKHIPLTDTDKMPFGKYIGTLMQDVPPEYLHYLWTKAEFKERTLFPGWNGDVARYIQDNLPALKKEYPDGIWS